ncbi:MAG: hypothetical protein MJE12_11165 [Alphaproteobacteria bacterium]|nr:hypothetical protein [Alphaproteobacteria bacterium]
MIKNRKRLTVLAAALLAVAGMTFATPSRAIGVDVGLTNSGVTGDNTTVFTADLGGLGLSNIGSITLTDGNSGFGGSGGAFSGFDLDGIYLETSDGTQINPTAFVFNAGAIRGGGPGPTFGATDATTIDNAVATLSIFDADDGVPDLGTVDGFLSLGDGGALQALFGPVAVTPGLTLFIGEVNLAKGESVSVHVAETPLPGAVWFFLSALLALAGMRLRRRAAANA